MAWKIDNVFHHNVPSAQDMAFDGRDIWVISPTTVTVLGYWDINTKYEGIHTGFFPDQFDTRNNINNEPVLHVIITGSPGDVGYPLNSGEFLSQIIKFYDKMYITVAANFDTPAVPITVDRDRLVAILVADIATKTIIKRIEVTVPEARANVAYQHDRMWFLDMAQKDDGSPDTQKLYFLNLLTETFSSGVTVPGRKQFASRRIFNSGQSHVIVTAQNDNAIMRFDDTTGDYIGTYIVNRDPTGLFNTGNANNDILIGSSDGMISLYNYNTNVVTHQPYATTDLPLDIADDGTYLWAITGLTLTRTRKDGNPDNFRYLSGENKDYTIDTSNFKQTSFKKMFITPYITYDYWNGSAVVQRTVRPYVFLLSSNYVQCFRTQALYRENIIRINCNAMIGTGPEKYYGETYE
jgi:hypothetical protein